jgi:hypothetical protein
MISVKTSADDFNRIAALSPAYESPTHNSPTLKQIDTHVINLFGFINLSSTTLSVHPVLLSVMALNSFSFEGKVRVSTILLKRLTGPGYSTSITWNGKDSPCSLAHWLWD